MARLDPQESSKALQDRVSAAVKDVFPVEGKRHTLRLDDISVNDNKDIGDIRSQKKARLEGRTWSVPVDAEMSLVDNATGKVIDTRKQRLMSLPKMTSRHSYIVDGQERQIDNQWRLKPGVYSRRNDRGDLESSFHLKGRSAFKVYFDDKTSQFTMKKKDTNIPLYPLMREMGVSDEDLEKQWGAKILEANKGGDAEKALAKFYRATTKEKPKDVHESRQFLKEFMDGAKMDPGVSELTLGKKFTHVTGESVVGATSKLLGISRGDVKPDVRDSLMFKTFHSAEDFAAEAITDRSKEIFRKIGNNLDRKKSIREVISTDVFNRPLQNLFTGAGHSVRPDQTNPLEMISGAMKTTIMGEGGIKSEHVITEDAKMIDPSHLGFLDPIHTPEGCYDDKTEVFTKSGWKLWNDITCDDSFACRIEGALTFSLPIKLIRAPYVGKMYGADTSRGKKRAKRKIDYLVTPNHRIYSRPHDTRVQEVQWRIERADAVHGKTRVLQLAHKAFKGHPESCTDSFDLPFVRGNNSSKNVGSVNFRDWAQFMGWYLSEGCYEYREGTSDYKTKISQSVRASALECEMIEALLDRLPFQWSFTERADGKRDYTISTKQLARYVSRFGRSGDKFIEEYFFDQGVTVREDLLECLLLGDGRGDSKRSDGSSYMQDVYTTTSPKLAVDVERLAIGLGYAVSVKKYEDPREIRFKDVYEIRILAHEERMISGRKGHFYVEDYDGVIYCAEVPGGLLYVRRNGGLAHWSGNSRTGVTLHLPLGASKKGDTVAVKMWSTKTGKMVDVDPKEAFHSKVVLPDQVRWEGGKPVAVGKTVKMSGEENEINDGRLKEADYVMPAPAQLFSISSNMVPFLQNNSGNRATYAGRQMEQAIPLKFREAPLVETVISAGKKETGLNDFMGKINSHTAPVSGEVVSLKKDAVIVKGTDGKEREVQIYDHFPLNDDKSFMHSTPIVKVGDTVKKGQTVADTNFTKGGKLALGTNLKAAYIPFHGYNFEDGVVISETAAKKLTSEHMHRKGLDTNKDHVLDKKKFIAHFDGELTKDQAEKLDDGGVVRKGQVIKPGDTLVAALRNREETDELKVRKRMHRSLATPFENVSVRWEGDHPGVVSNVVKRGKRTEVHVKTDEPAEIGDKLTGRHGNKGIITCHDQKTEVLTSQGWKLFKDLDKTETICTRNPDTGEIEYQDPTSYIDQPHEGKMYFYGGRRLNLCTTPEHNHYVRTRRGQFKLESAEACFGRPRIHIRTGKWAGSEIQEITIPGRPDGPNLHKEFCKPRSYEADLFLEFFGFWVTEGCLGGTTHIHLAQSKQVNGPTYERMLEVLREMGYEPCQQDNVLVISDPRLHHWLRQFGKARDKFIPRKFMEVTPRQLRILADAVFAGDGGVYFREKDNHTRFELFTSSTKLAGDYQELALKVGFSANVKEPKPGEYVVRWSFKDETWTNNDKRYGNEFWVERSERVYCVDVPNHIIYVRREGIPVWSGNCILPDHDMPKTGKGKHIEIALNPAGVPGRLNLGQVLETAAGKIAEKTGKPYRTQNFDGSKDKRADVEKELKSHGIEDKEEVFDAQTSKSMGKVLVGPHYIHKLKHQVGKKLVARAGGPGYAYDRNKMPKGGGPHGAQALDSLGVYAMLAHGATENMREMQTYKSNAENNDQFWSAIQSGDPLPPPRPTFAYNKFSGLLKAVGVNMVKEGNSISLMPLLDKQIVGKDGISAGEIKDAGLMVTGKDFKEEKKGLFDPAVTGGKEGTNWSHIKLPEPMPNPVFEKSILSLTGLKQKELDGLMTGKTALDPKTGKITGPEDGLSAGPAIAHLLKKINVGKDLAAAEADLKKDGLKGNRLDRANKKVKYLRNLQKLGVTPTEAYMTRHVPVLPPSMRPVSALPDGTLINDDLNHMYKGLGIATKKFKDTNPNDLPEEFNKRRAAIYDGMKALTGVGGHQNRKFRGVLDIISGKVVDKDNPSQKGGAPRESFFQSKLIKRKQDMSMRSTIIPEPELGLDQVGIPRKAAMEIYKPFVVRELRGMADVSPLQAQKMVKSQDPMAQRALERVISERPVMLKRDPVLHKYGVQAFKPVLTSGKAVKIHPLVTGGFNADFDGDTMSAFVPVGHEAVSEAKKMFPSRNLFSPATGGLMYRPSHESQLGIYTLTQEGKQSNQAFKTVSEAAKAAHGGKIGMTDSVRIGSTKTTVGRALVANALPKAMQAGVLSGKVELDGDGQAELLSRVAKQHKNEFGDVSNRLKDLGNRFATTSALSIGLADIKTDKVEREKILSVADRKVAEIMKGTGTKEDKEKKKVQVYDAASAQMIKTIEAKHSKKGSTIYTMMKAGVKPKMGAYRQITMAPMLMMNAKGETIPTPIRKSWAEGLDTGDYWTQMSGARKGVVQKVQSVQEPGYFTKQMINSVMNNAIGSEDCATGKGISLPVDERDIMDRYLAADVKSGSKTFKSGTLITPGVRDSMRNNRVRRVVVRSPLRCEHGDGICSKCYGLDENGENPTIGKNVGITSAQAIGERATQLAMRTFHEGGIAPVGKRGREKAVLADEFRRVQELVQMPKHIPGAATLSTVSGKVTKVQKDSAGGTNVFVNDVRHYVPQDRGEPTAFVGDRAQKIRRGMQIGKGSPISPGPVNVNEMLPLTGINKVQGYMAGQLYGLYKGEGIRRRNIETVVKSMTNLTFVQDPGDHKEFLRGDFAPTSQVQVLNKKLAAAKKRPVEHTPVLKGVKTLPLDMQTDWMARLNHENLNATIVDAANQGWSANIHGKHPVPALAYGAEFGKKKPY